MLDQVNKNIQRYVDSAGYFTDVREWYAYKYLLPFTLRSYMMLILIAVSIASYIMYQLVKQDAELKQMPFPMYAYDTVNYFPHIQPLTDIKEPINISIARYMVGQYVKLRESYSYSDFQGENMTNALARIKTLSSLKIYRDYADYVDPETNPDSPLIRYKDKTRRTITVKTVELFGLYDLPERAKVVFESKEKSKTAEEVTTWEAEINFKMLDLEKKDKDGKSNLSFTVISYTTYKL